MEIRSRKGKSPTQVGAKTDLPLTIQGKGQAHSFAKYLKSHGMMPKAVFAGTLKRQIKSATILEHELHLAPNSIHLNEAALTEIDYGAWEGLTSVAIEEKWAKEYEGWTTRAEWPKEVFKGSFEVHLQALKSWISHLRTRYEEGDVIVGVTSNGIIRFFYALQEKGGWDTLRESGQIEDLKVKTGHFCELDVFEDAIEVKSWNQNPV